MNRETRAALAAGVAGVTWWAGEALAKARPVKAGALFLLASAALAGMTAQSKAASAHKRIDKLVGDVAAAKTGGLANGGTMHGSLTIQGTLDVQGGLDMNNYTISRVNYINPADGNSNVHSSGGFTAGGNIDLAGSNVVNCNAISNGGSQVGHPSGLSAASIGPGGTRANLGSFGTDNLANLNAVAARCDWLNGQGNAANWNY